MKLHPQHRMLQERLWEALLSILRTDGAGSLDMPSLLRNVIETMKRHPGPIRRIACDIMTWCCLPELAGDAAETQREQLLELDAPKVVSDAMRQNLQVVELQESACACLQCLAMANPRNLTGVEDALLMALEAQGKSEAVQIRGIDLLSALAQLRRGAVAGPLLRAVDLAIDALRNHGQEDSSLAEVSVRFLLRMLDCTHGTSRSPMESIVEEVLDFLGESSPTLATRTFLRRLARHSHDVAERFLASQGVLPVAEAGAPPLLTMQLLSRLADGGLAARRALLWCPNAIRRSWEALRCRKELTLEDTDDSEPVALRSCACILLSRLAADGDAAVASLLLVETGVDMLELVLAQLEVVTHPELMAWSFLTLHNLVCGVSTAALSRKTWLLQRGVLRLVSAAAAEQSLGNSSMGTAAAAAAAAARMRLETILIIGLHNLCAVLDLKDTTESSVSAELLSEEVVSMLLRGLGHHCALEVRERACFLLCYLANCTQKVKDTLLAGGSSLWKSLLEVLKDHLTSEEEEGCDESEELLLELSLPTDGVSLLPVECQRGPLRALQVRTPELLLEAMQALPFEARVQVTACTTLRRLALLAVQTRGGADRHAQCLSLVQRLPRAMEAAVQAMKHHERSDEVQRASVLAFQALIRLSCSLEGEDVAIERAVAFEIIPFLSRALRNYPEDPQTQERGLDALRLLATRRETVTQELCGLQMVPAVVEAMNLNISKPKVQEYGLSLLAEVGWQGQEQQLVISSSLGIETVVRALKAFPSSGEVQMNGLAAVQAITSDNEECRVKFFCLCEILEIVLQAMGNFPLVEGVQAFGCAALISLVHSKSERIGALADLNCASMAESAMVGHPKSQRVLEFAEHLMQVLKKG